MKKFIIIIVPVVLAVVFLSSCAGGKQVKATSKFALTPVTQDTLVALGFTFENIKTDPPLAVYLSEDLVGICQGVETTVVDGFIQVQRKPNLVIKASSLGEVLSWEQRGQNDAASTLIKVSFQDLEDESLSYEFSFFFSLNDELFHPKINNILDVGETTVNVSFDGEVFAFEKKTWEAVYLNFRSEEIRDKKERKTGDRKITGTRKLK